MPFPERLKSLREQERYSLNSLSKLIGVKVNTIWRWENNQAKPNTATLVKVARALNTTVAYLLDETDNPAPNSSDSPIKASEQIQGILDLAKRMGNEDHEMKEPIYGGVSGNMIIIRDDNTKQTFSFPNNEEGLKAFIAFLNYSLGLKTSTVSNTINGDNNNGNQLGLINQ